MLQTSQKPDACCPDERAIAPSSISLKSVATRLLPAMDQFIQHLVVLRSRLDRSSVPIVQEFQPSVTQPADDRFLATVFHELRSPLNAVLGWARIIRSPSVSQDLLTKGLETIERNAQLQAQLLDDLLDLHRFSQGKLKINPQPINLGVIVNATAETIRVTADAKTVNLSVQLSQSPVWVSADSTRLQQIIWNLLTNAIKFTPSGGSVNVEVGVRSDSAVLVVQDTGKGIAPDFLPYVFQSFSQQETLASSTSASLGLGLAIVQELVLRHNGQVSAASGGDNQGATFTVQLPLLKDF